MQVDWEAELLIIRDVAIAAVLGGVVGTEREISNKPAGLRTHMIVAAAAALFTSLGLKMVHDFSALGTGVGADPVRVLQAIIVGISFLGAGTIVNRGADGQVEGLTTAASVLLVTGIGISVGMGQLVVAAGITVLMLVVLVGIHFLERLVVRLRRAGKEKSGSDGTG